MPFAWPTDRLTRLTGQEVVIRIVSFSDARNSLKGVLDQTILDADFTVITRRDAPDVVVMSFDTFMRSLFS